MLCGSRAFSGKIRRSFLPQVVPPFTTMVSSGDTQRCKQERLKTGVCTISLRLQCIRGHQPPGPYHNTIQYNLTVIKNYQFLINNLGTPRVLGGSKSKCYYVIAGSVNLPLFTPRKHMEIVGVQLHSILASALDEGGC